MGQRARRDLARNRTSIQWSQMDQHLRACTIYFRAAMGRVAISLLHAHQFILGWALEFGWPTLAVDQHTSTSCAARHGLRRRFCTCGRPDAEKAAQVHAAGHSELVGAASVPSSTARSIPVHLPARRTGTRLSPTTRRSPTDSTARTEGHPSRYQVWKLGMGTTLLPGWTDRTCGQSR